MGPGFFIFFYPVINAKPPLTNSGGYRYFSYDPDLKEIRTICPVPEAEKHCIKAKQEFKLFKLHDQRIVELRAILDKLRELPRLLSRRQFISRAAKKREVVLEMKKEIKAKRTSEEILMREEEAIVALMFSNG